MIEILKSQNKKWGFYGTAKNCLKTDKKTKKAWCEIFTLIIEIAGFTPQETLKLLDSRWGRHTVDRFYDELKNGTFSEIFKEKISEEELYESFNYYVDPKAYVRPYPENYLNFCKELTKLSRKYSLVIQSVGGVFHDIEGFEGYNPDLESGDLTPIWKK